MDKIIRAIKLKCFGALDLILKENCKGDQFLFSNIVYLLTNYLITDKIDNYTYIKVFKILLSNGMKFDKLTNMKELIEILKDRKKDIPYGILTMGISNNKFFDEIKEFVEAIKKSNINNKETLTNKNIHTYILNTLLPLVKSFNDQKFLEMIKINKIMEIDKSENLKVNISQTFQNKTECDKEKLMEIFKKEILTRLEKIVDIFEVPFLKLCKIRMISLQDFQKMSYQETVSYYTKTARNLETYTTSIFRKSNIVNETILGLQKMFKKEDHTAKNIYMSHSDIVLMELTNKYFCMKPVKMIKN